MGIALGRKRCLITESERETERAAQSFEHPTRLAIALSLLPDFPPAESKVCSPFGAAIYVDPMWPAVLASAPMRNTA